MNARACLAEIHECLTHLDTGDQPGLAVIVVDRGEIAHAAGYGLANLEHKVPWTVDTPTRIASTTKMFIAAALLAAADRLDLPLGESIRRWFPELPKLYDAVTLHHSILCRGGFRYDEGLAWLAGRTTATRGDLSYLYGLMRRQTALNFLPGGFQQYCCNGFRFAYTLIDRIAPGGAKQFLQEALFNPAEMHKTRLVEFGDEVVSGLQSTYEVAGPDSYRRYLGLMTSTGDGGLVSTATDLAAWCNAALNRGSPIADLASEIASSPALPEERPCNYGHGVFIGAHRGVRWFGATGGLHAYTAVMIYPEEELGIVVVSNRDDLSPRAFTHHLFDLVRPGRSSAEPDPSFMSPTQKLGWRDDLQTQSGQKSLFMAPETGWIAERTALGRATQLELMELSDIFLDSSPAESRASLGRYSGILRGATNGDAFDLDFGRRDIVHFHRAETHTIAQSRGAKLQGTFWSDEISAGLQLIGECDTLFLRVAGGADPRFRIPVKEVGDDLLYARPVAMKLLDPDQLGRPTTLSVSTGRVFNVIYRRIA